MMNRISNEKIVLTALGLIALAASSVSARGIPTSPDGEDPLKLGTIPFVFAIDINDLLDPLDKDDILPSPLAYVDIPEIDREPEDDLTPPAASTIPSPGNLFDPFVDFSNPFLIPTNGFGEGFNFELDITTSPGLTIAPIASLSVPTPGTAFIGGLAAGVLFRRRR